MSTVPTSAETGVIDKPPKRFLTATRLKGFAYNDAPQPREFIFICGLHRSGTTLLERLLTARYDVSCLRARVPESEGQHLQPVYSPAERFGGCGRFAFSDEMHAELSGLSDHDDCRNRILAGWGRFTVGTAPVLVEKSPPNLTKIWWLRRVFPRSRFVVLVRDPRAVAAASRNLTDASLPDLIRHWHAAHARAVSDFSPVDCIVSRYEDLTRDPDAELRRIAGFCGLQPRAEEIRLDERFRDLRNSNARYIDRHLGARYGEGVWERFGYQI